MLKLWSGKSIEDFTMNPVRPVILSLIIPNHPLLKRTTHRVLKFKRGVLLWLPRTPEIVCKADIEPWVEKDQQRAMGRRRADQFAIAAFDDPVTMRVNEGLKRSRD